MHWNAGPIFSYTCAIPTARSGVLNWNIWWKCAVLVSLHTPLREIPRRGILVASSREVNFRFWFLVGSIRNVTRQKDCPELQESAIPSPKICHDLGWNQKPEAKQKKITNGWWHKIQKTTHSWGKNWKPKSKSCHVHKTEIPNCPMISLHSSYLGFTIIFLVVTDFCLNFIQLSVVFVSVSMFSHNNSYSQVKIIKCFYFELFIGNGIYREQPWGSGLSLRFKPKNRPAGMGCIDNLFQSECIPLPFKYI